MYLDDWLNKYKIVNNNLHVWEFIEGANKTTPKGSYKGRWVFKMPRRDWRRWGWVSGHI